MQKLTIPIATNIARDSPKGSLILRPGLDTPAKRAATPSLVPVTFGPSYRLNGAVQPPEMVFPSSIPREPGTHNPNKFNETESVGALPSNTTVSASLSSRIASIASTPTVS